MRTLIVLAVITGLCGFASCAENPSVNTPLDNNAGAVNNILDGLQKAAAGLKSYQCKVEYQFSQPVLESKTLRTGTMQYARSDGGSKLRIEFNMLTQDDGPQQKYVESYIFDGLWLTHVDYQIKQVQKRQLAEANEPLDAFELARRNFPIIGFSKTDDLKKRFDVSLVGEPNGLIHLHLKVRPDSQHKDDYKSAEVWIDKATMLPVRIVVVSTEDDVYEIKFVEPLVNEPIDEKVFELKIPPGFGKPEIIPLKN